MRNFSKSRLVSMLQCPRRFWLEVFRPELKTDSQQTEIKFKTGNEVGDVARAIFDPTRKGVLLDLKQEGYEQAITRSNQLLLGNVPIFEAGMVGGGVLAFADVMLPGHQKASWKMIEVKSSTSVKEYHLDDIAIQTYAARSADVEIESVSLAHIDSSWVYPGDQDFSGLFTVNDLTHEAISRHDEVAEWVKQAQSIAQSPSEPTKRMGSQCTEPFECGFITHCSQGVATAEFPVHWLPRINRKKIEELEASGITDLRDVPDVKLSSTQLRVKQASKTGIPYFDSEGASKDLEAYPRPCLFLDFESAQFAVPRWPGTRPYQQICFQFSLHILGTDDLLDHKEFIDLSGDDPSEAFAKSLIDACGEEPHAIFVYNASFEKTRIAELAKTFPQLANPLLSINSRIVDLQPITKNRYYHPLQRGSWSIKNVLSALVPELKYADLDGVKDGNMAMLAYQEAISSYTSVDRKSEIRAQLLKYCQLDTYSMVRIWQAFSK